MDENLNPGNPSEPEPSIPPVPPTSSVDPAPAPAPAQPTEPLPPVMPVVPVAPPMPGTEPLPAPVPVDPAAADASHKRRNIIIAVIAGALILFCMCCGVLGAISQSLTTNTATESFEYQPPGEVTIESPIQDFEPLDIPPIDVPAVPEAEAADDEVALSLYALEVSPIIADLGDALQNLETILYEANPIEVFTDTPVRAEMFIEVARIKAARPLIDAITPPARMQPAHDDLKQAVQYFDEAMDIFVEGIENVDGDKLDEATVLLENGATLLQGAAVKMSEAVGL